MVNVLSGVIILPIKGGSHSLKVALIEVIQYLQNKLFT